MKINKINKIERFLINTGKIVTKSKRQYMLDKFTEKEYLLLEIGALTFYFYMLIILIIMAFIFGLP